MLVLTHAAAAAAALLAGFTTSSLVHHHRTTMPASCRSTIALPLKASCGALAQLAPAAYKSHPKLLSNTISSSPRRAAPKALHPHALAIEW
jgi:hypothetical protein